jgi:cold-inducible RNA-binding protein
MELDSMTKIYVGNLPFSTDENEIRTLFSQHGTVESVNVITDRDTGRPRGFAFVEMPRARSRISTARSSAGVLCA